MASDATFDNQLQALATATSNFANGKDDQIKNTIITALGGSTQSGGGSSAKTEPTLTITHNPEFDGESDIGFEISYNGDGHLFAKVNNTYAATRLDTSAETPVLYVSDYEDTTFTVSLHATEGSNYAAKTVSATYAV